jgi:hypothetical protein
MIIVIIITGEEPVKAFVAARGGLIPCLSLYNPP